MSDSLAKVQVDLEVYSMEAVLKSAYRFTAKCFVDLRKLDERIVEVSIRPKNSEDSADKIIPEFLNDLIDQRLRTIVAAETAITRDLIMAHALSRSGFLRPEFEDSASADDPIGISVPDRLKTAH